jgi:hypothetical protein
MQPIQGNFPDRDAAIFRGSPVNRPHLLVAVGFAVAAAAVGLALALRSEDDRRVEMPPIPVAATVHSEAPAPLVEVVRVGERGDMVMAGQSLPKAEIVIEAGGQALGTAVADARGEWVFVPTAPPEPGLQVLTVRVRDSGGAPTQVLLIMPAAPDDRAWVLAADQDGRMRLLGAAGGTALAVEMIDRDGRGRLSLVGRGEVGRSVQLFLGNRPLGRTSVDGDGDWRLAVDAPAESGTLRIELTDGRSKVQDRLELPLPGSAAGAGFRLSRPDAATWRIERPGGGATHLLAPDPSRRRMMPVSPAAPR